MDVAKLNAGAKSIASSSYLEYPCHGAMDSKEGSFHDGWASCLLSEPTALEWLHIEFAATYQLRSTRLMQMPQDNDSAKDIELTYSGGETEMV